MNIFSLINGNNYHVYNREFAKKIGLNQTIFLSELLDKYEFFKNRNQLTLFEDYEGEWFYLTAEDAFDRTALTEKEQRTSIESLLNKGFIKKIQKGLPARRYFQICQNKILEFFGFKGNITSLDKTPNLSGETPNWNSQKAKLDQPKGQTAPIYKEPEEDPKKGEEVRARDPKQPKKSYSKHVEMEEEEFDKLVATHGKEKILDYIERVNDYIAQQGKDKYSDHAATIRNWIRRDAPNTPEAKKIITQEEENQSLVAKILFKYPDRNDIHYGNDYIEFINGMQSDFIKFSDFGFKDKVTNNLRKRNLIL